MVGKPYLEIIPDRDAMARHGMSIEEVLQVVEVAVGGKPITRTVEGRERYPVRVRYQEELRDSTEAIQEILVSGTSIERGGRIRECLFRCWKPPLCILLPPV